MPVRLLRPGLRDSIRFNSCSFAAQSLYVRLLTLVDDWGRYDAEPNLIRGHAFARMDGVTDQDVEILLKELEDMELLLRWRTDYGAISREFLTLTSWREKPRSPSRFPDPPEAIREHLLGIDCKCLLPKPSPSPSPSPLNYIPAVAGAQNGKLHKEFIEKWVAAWEKTRNEKYAFNGGKDGAAVKRLMSTKIPVDELIAIAQRAWGNSKGFHCKSASSIAGFASKFNEIRTELKPTKPAFRSSI